MVLGAAANAVSSDGQRHTWLMLELNDKPLDFIDR